MELPTLGAHCSLPSCTALDFLPFPCPKCPGAFCPAHRHYASHACPGDPDRVVSAEDAQKGESEKAACGREGCGVREVRTLLSTCAGCGGAYCLAHRHAADHACASLGDREREKEKKKEEAKDFVGKHMGTALGKPAATTSAAPAKPPPKPKKLNLQIEIMKLKQRAKGDPAVPMESRVYLTVRMPKEAGGADEPCFFHRDWTVGRIVDLLAKQGKVANRNNVSSDPGDLLALFSAEGARFDTARTLGELAAEGAASGSRVVFERGPYEP
ncbi:hypothetical protein DFJ74DRAFT_764229 [Hyaloraphidium curvatum]|nr:hypothetical protein DFJ74DRAFT_764229 [Hyaloraphidium curvatum]